MEVYRPTLGGHAVGGGLEIVGLDVADHPLAIIEQFQGILDAQIAEVEGDAGAGMERQQFAEQRLGRKP